MLGKSLTSLGLACAVLGLAACAPSPLYVTERPRGGTGGEVPRDGTGEPLWSAIPAAPRMSPRRDVPPAPGIAVTGAVVTAPPPAYVAPARAAVPATTDADYAAPPPPPAPVAVVPRKKRPCHSFRRCD